MTDNFQYRRYNGVDKEQVLALYRSVFTDLGLEEDDNRVLRLERQLAQNKAVVALNGNTIVGMLSFDRFQDMESKDLEEIENILGCAYFEKYSVRRDEGLNGSDPAFSTRVPRKKSEGTAEWEELIQKYERLRQSLREYLEESRKQLGSGEVILEYFPEAFYDVPLVIPKESVFATDFAVHPTYQNNQLGFELASYALRRIEKSGAPGIYGVIMDRTPIRMICEQLGFRSLLRYGPAYKNGEATIYIGRSLQ